MIYLGVSLYLKQQPKKNILIYQHCLVFSFIQYHIEKDYFIS